MKQALVLTVISADKPGLVERLSEAISASDGNWEESRMAHLGGRFAGIILVTIDRGRQGDLETSLVALREQGIHIHVQPWEPPESSGSRSDSHTAPADWRPWRIDLTGNDHPGIVCAVSRTLAHRGINVEELKSSVDSAPMAGDMLFTMMADITCPPHVDIDELRNDLESLAGDLMVDISLRSSDTE